MTDKIDILDELKRYVSYRCRGDDESGVAIPPRVLDEAIAEIEHLRALAGAVTDGDSFADIRKAIKQA